MDISCAVGEKSRVKRRTALTAYGLQTRDLDSHLCGRGGNPKKKGWQSKSQRRKENQRGNGERKRVNLLSKEGGGRSLAVRSRTSGRPEKCKRGPLATPEPYRKGR